ncbi:uncharacterized protein LOC141713763 [Apium graveolens]|uniref:uncharacterized protein LOC141713763 n=1 Tax=Apium graveolens TaxID=4045 RepID=UPI003D791FA9
MSRFTIADNELFKKSSTGLFQRCLKKYEADMVLRDAHEGECGNHTKWEKPFTENITLRLLLANVKPSELLNMSIPSWPFMKWGMDIVGKMPPAPGQIVFLLVMTDYFLKWIEAKAFKQVTSKEVISFIKRNILCKFDVPSEIICDNGSQFISKKMKAFCKRWNINLIKSTPRYPQANGQAESSNKS